MPAVLCVGHAVQDFVFTVPSRPDRGAKYRATSFTSVGGGPAATAAVAIARLGGQAVLAARVGDDAAADMIVAELRGHGVDCTYVRRCAGCASSASAVIVDARGERMIVNNLDPAIPADPAWLPAPAAVCARAVLVDTRWPEGALATLQAARAAGKPAVLDADRPIPPDGALLRAATHVAFSADALLGIQGAPVLLALPCLSRMGYLFAAAQRRKRAYNLIVHERHEKHEQKYNHKTSRTGLLLPVCVSSEFFVDKEFKK